MSYPVSFAMDYILRRSRLTTFFRWLLAIPHFVFATIYGFAASIVLIVAWFALLLTARWPASLYEFVAGFIRYTARLSAYLYLGVDRYPPFGGADDDAYPVRVRIAPPLERYSRVKVLFRWIYAIGAIVIRYAMGIILSLVSLASWFVIIVTGRQPESFQNAINFALTYTIRADALLFLLTETYPPFESAQPTMKASS